MIRAVILSIAIILGAKMSHAQDSAGIEATITAQMEAFRAEDSATAFGFASPVIQGLFGSSERFETMVRRGYPMVWDNAEVRYLDLEEFAGQMVQVVQVEDENGTIHYLAYEMVEIDGAWRINGVQLLPQPDFGA